MANFKLKISFVFIIFLFFSLNLTIANENIPKTKLENYEEIYENLQEPDFDYLFNIDPNQAEEYTRYMYSPYPLFRSGVNLIFKSKLIPPGYYLLTPKEYNDKTWILFKENGKISYVIPTYKIENVSVDFYEDKFPKEKLNLIQKAGKGTMGFIGKTWGHKNQRTPIPKAYIEFDDRGEFWDMILYYELKKYYLLFKKG